MRTVHETVTMYYYTNLYTYLEHRNTNVDVVQKYKTPKRH